MRGKFGDEVRLQHILDEIIGMRNVFVHEYFGVDTYLVWEIIKNGLPDLKIKVIEILDQVNKK